MPGIDGERAGAASFADQYAALKGEVDAYLSENLPVFDAEGHALLGEAMRYSVLAGGKRIRGVLALAVRDMLARGKTSEVYPDKDNGGGDDPEASDYVIHIAGAIEYIHTYSLIHDDMPCMDDDDYRRGKPSCHKAFGEGMAMLAGDALLNLAFEILTDKAAVLAQLSCPANRATARSASACFASATALVARAAGGRGMAGGQAIDLMATLSEEALLDNMHRLKTGMMFGAAILAPALCMGASEADYEALSRYSDAVGLAFQVRDDLSDMVETGGGANDGERLNYATLFGVERARLKLDALCREALLSLERFSARADFLRHIAKQITS